MRVAMVHNYYRQPGGEDHVFEAEAELLEQRGHSVSCYTAHNDDLQHLGSLALARATIWNGSSYRELRSLVRSQRIEVVHFHNTFPLISPSAHYAAKVEGAAVVQTLHNFRLTCVNGLLSRDGRVCEDCVGRSWSWPGVLNGCYRDSRPVSAVVAIMNAAHRWRGTWREMVDVFVALSESSRSKLVAAGLPTGKIVVKPNFVIREPSVGAGDGDYALFVGRLSEEKGIRTLIDAWGLPESRVEGETRMPLKIAGDGPLRPFVDAAAAANANIEVLGHKAPDQVTRLMQRASFLVMPSTTYENFPIVLAEAFAAGLPAVVSGHGAMEEIIESGVTGCHFRPGDPSDLASRVAWLAARPRQLHAMRLAARERFESEYSCDASYDRLIAIYARAVAAASNASGGAVERRLSVQPGGATSCEF